MNYRTLTYALSYALSVSLIGTTNPAIAQNANAPADIAAVLAPLVNDDTFSAGYLRLSEASDVEQLRKLLLQLPQQSPQDTLVLNALVQSIGGLQSAGATDAYFVFGLGNVHLQGGPLVIVHSKSGADQSSLENMLRATTQSIALLPGMAPILMERRGSDTFVIGSEAAMARYKGIQASPRSDLFEPLEKLADGGAKVAAVFSPGADFRRVVRELWPAFPAPLAAWKGELADQWLRLEFSAKEPTVASASLTLVTRDPQSAQTFVELLTALPDASPQLADGQKDQIELHRFFSTIVGSLTTRIDGPRVVMTLPSGGAQLEHLKSLLGEASASAAASAQTRQRANQFKQIAIAFFVYADAQKHLPPAAICDATGKPLLSWRVAILPYLDDQNELFKQFHLDEAWDSPHNLALAAKIPAVYRDPSQPALSSAGKTPYLVPVGTGTMFDSKTGLAFRDVKDGLSHTVMIVEVLPETAVIWTKPDDWEVDMANPLRGVARTDRDFIVAAWADGSVQAIRTDVKPEAIKAYLTRAGGETVDRP